MSLSQSIVLYLLVPVIGVRVVTTRDVREVNTTSGGGRQIAHPIKDGDLGPLGLGLEAFGDDLPVVVLPEQPHSHGELGLHLGAPPLRLPLLGVGLPELEVGGDGFPLEVPLGAPVVYEGVPLPLFRSLQVGGPDLDVDPGDGARSHPGHLFGESGD